MTTDYISREAAIEKARNLYPSIDHYCISINAVPVRDLNAIPSADVAPVVHAHWERVVGGVHFPFRCSRCGEKADSNEYTHCHCGARMDEEEK